MRLTIINIMMKRLVAILLKTALLISLFSCVGAPNPKEEDLTPAEYFQRAYEARDKQDFGLAISYYNAFMEKHPGDTERIVWAQFELAFTYYKKGNMTTALEMLEALISRYDEENSEQLPLAPKALAEKVKKKISDEKK